MIVGVSLMARTCKALAQSSLWIHVPTQLSAAPRLTAAKLSSSELKSIAGVVRRWGEAEKGGCDGKDELEELVERIKVQSIPLSPSQKVLLVEAGMGCARGGRGANGVMWVIRLDGGVAVTLAGPRDGFSGWLYSILRSANDGYRDIVLGWHMSAVETDMSYFRFDGKRYRLLGCATGLADEMGHMTIEPKQQSAKRSQNQISDGLNCPKGGWG